MTKAYLFYLMTQVIFFSYKEILKKYIDIIKSTIYDQILIWSGESEYLIGSCELRDPLHNLMFPRSNSI